MDKITNDCVKEIIDSIITIIDNNDVAGIDINDLKFLIKDSKQVTLKRGIGLTLNEAFNNAIENNIYGNFDISKANKVLLTVIFDKNAKLTIFDIRQLNEEIKNKFPNVKPCKVQTLQKSDIKSIQIIMILSF